MTGNFCRFGLIVTGSSERECLPRLFRSLSNGASCHFRVLRKIGQRSPTTSPRKLLRMIGSGKLIPDRDAEDIGFPARRFLAENERHFVLIVDDLEHDRREQAEAVFGRYRRALDTILVSQSQQKRAAVHFLANMLEAYYFADCTATNTVAGRQVLEGDYAGDVEEIRHPKNELTARWPEYREVVHGPLLLKELDVPHVLSNGQTCRWLRSIFAWCVTCLHGCGAIWDQALTSHYRLQDGAMSPTTFPQ